VAGTTRTFSYASVVVGRAEAEATVAELRERIGSPATEYKATHLLRPRSAPALHWFLSAAGPVAGRSHVVLVDKPLFLVRRFAGQLQAGYAGGTSDGSLIPVLGDKVTSPVGEVADALTVWAPRLLGEDRWEQCLRVMEQLLHDRLVAPAELLHDALATLAGADVARARSAARWVLEFRHDLRAWAAPGQPPRLMAGVSTNPLYWALVDAVVSWSRARATPVDVLHDRQALLTTGRIALVRRSCGQLPDARHRLGAVDQVDSDRDARVQLADFLAGIVRRLGELRLLGAANGAWDHARPLLGAADASLVTAADRTTLGLDPVSGP